MTKLNLETARSILNDDDKTLFVYPSWKLKVGLIFLTIGIAATIPMFCNNYAKATNKSLIAVFVFFIIFGPLNFLLFKWITQIVFLKQWTFALTPFEIIIKYPFFIKLRWSDIEKVELMQMEEWPKLRFIYLTIEDKKNCIKSQETLGGRMAAILIFIEPVKITNFMLKADIREVYFAIKEFHNCVRHVD
jgi:hypothetical protein